MERASGEKSAQGSAVLLCSSRMDPREIPTVVGLGGLEPPASPLSGVRSNHLSYRPSLACLLARWTAATLSRSRSRTDVRSLVCSGGHFASEPKSVAKVTGWWSLSGSNRRPPACKAGALPAELKPQAFAGAHFSRATNHDAPASILRSTGTLNAGNLCGRLATAKPSS